MGKPRQPHLRAVPGCGRDLLEGAGPYKSGRIRWRETPESSSTFSTFLGGTPFLRQRYKDCGVIPSAEVSALYPPAPSKMSSSMSSMQATLQPKAGNGQQPKAAIQLHSIVGMTSPAKIKAKEQFGERLSAVLDGLRWERKKRPERLKMVMKSAGVHVTYETTRTWINGTKVPSGAHVQILCKELGANPTYLQTGEGEMFVTDPKDDELAEFQRSWPGLGPAARAHMLQTLYMVKQAELAGEKIPSTQKRTSRK
jgi:hypothetical protein